MCDKHSDLVETIQRTKGLDTLFSVLLHIIFVPFCSISFHRPVIALSQHHLYRPRPHASFVRADVAAALRTLHYLNHYLGMKRPTCIFP